MMRILFLIGFLIVGLLNLSSQCEVEISDPIFSNETGQYQILVDGLLNDQLGVNQGLCGVQIEFSHNSITNLRISLTSPNGEVVYLVGPANSQGTISSFIDWDVTFIPCGSLPNSDPDIPNQWSNNSGWTSITDYTGSYFPSGGCLEDFDSGSANGTWTITVEDLGQSNNGEIVDIELIFCEPIGLTCDLCDVQLINFKEGSYYYCQGQSIEFIVEESFVGLSSGAHQEYLVLVQGGVILEIQDVVMDISGLASGIYQIYGLVTQDDVSVFTTIAELQSNIIDGVLCADLSEDVIDLVIGELNGQATIQENICSNNGYLWKGDVLFPPLDTMIFVNTSEGCDSVFTIQLTEVMVVSEIDPIFGVLQCGEEVVITAANTTTSQMGIAYQWYTIDGSIIAGANTPFLVVNQAGEYFLRVEKGDCSATSSVILESADNFVGFNLNLDQLDCNQGIYTINNNLTIAIDTYEWLFNGIPFNDVLVPTVTQEGTYTLVIESQELPCGELTASITLEDVELPQIVLQKTSEIDCINDSATLFVEDYGSETYGMSWLYDGVVIDQDVNSIIVTIAGEYELQIVLPNGCIISETISVLNQVANYTTELNVDSLSCQTQEGQIFITTDGNIEEVEWRGPFGFYSVDRDPRVFRFGTYRVDILFDDGCTQRLFIEVDYDLQSPVVDLSSAPIDCNNDFGVLFVIAGHQVDYLYNWAGPGGFESSLYQPIVYQPGRYFVTVTDMNGCEAYYFQDVGVDTISAQFNIQVDLLTCVTLSTDLEIEYDATLIDSIHWSGPDIDALNNQLLTPTIAQGGLYVVTGNTTNGCSFENSVEVEVDTISPELLAPFEYYKPCENLDITISSSTVGNIVDYTWSEPFESAQDLIVSNSGNYTLTITDQNGCTDIGEYVVDQPLVYPSVVIQYDSLFLTCQDASIEVDVSVEDAINIGNYQWSIFDQNGNLNPIQVRSDGSLYFLVDEEGQHRAEILSEIGCILADTVTIVRDTVATIPIFSLDTFTCSVTSQEVNIDNIEDYSTADWYVNEEYVMSGESPLYFSSQEFSVLLTDFKGCDTLILFDAPIDSLVPQFTISELALGDCNQINSSLSVNIENSTDFVMFWSTQDGNILSDPYEATISVDSPGTYLCVVTDQSSSCSMSNSIVVTGNVFIDLSFDIVQPSCPNDDGYIEHLIVETTSGLLLEEMIVFIDDAEVVYTGVEQLDLSPGEHELVIFDAEGCSIDTVFTIDAINAIDLEIEELNPIVLGDSILVVSKYNTGIIIDEFDWESNPSLVESAWYQPEATQSYMLTAFYGDGCSESVDFEIIVEERSYFFSNNIFNPTLGGENGQLIIKPTSAINEISNIQIFDRWGNMVCKETTVIDAFNWDGIYNGIMVEQGVYIVIIDFVTTSGRDIREIFDVTVVR